MFVPTAFKKLCIYFHQDVGVDSSDPQEWIAFAQRHLSDSEKLVVKHFLGQLLDGTHGGPELQRVWFSADAEIAFPDDTHLRLFLSKIRDTL